MHMILVMCDSSTVTVLVFLRVNLCHANSFNTYTRVHDEGTKYRNTFPCRGQIVNKEEFSKRLCVARS